MPYSTELLDNIPKHAGTIVVPPATGYPIEALGEIYTNADMFEDLTILGMHSPQEWPYHPEIRRVSTFFSSADRSCYRPSDGSMPSVEAVDVHFSGMFDYMKNQGQRQRPDLVVALATVARNGMRSLGTNGDYTHALIDYGVPVYVFEHPDMPWVNGNQFSEKQVVGVTQATHKLHEVASKTSTHADIDQRIASHISNLVPDQATLQLGVGYLPGLVLENVADRVKDIWSEALNNSMTKLRRGIQIVGTVALGDHELWKFMNNNPDVTILPAHITNDANQIRRRNITSINQAMAVTLRGETVVGVGHRYSGAGGQRDFSANASNSIIALHSTRTNADGELISNIIPFAGPNDHIVLPAMDRTKYVVTEHGVAELKGPKAATVADVARQLIYNCVHPDLRDEMFERATDCGYFASGRRRPVLAGASR